MSTFTIPTHIQIILICCAILIVPYALLLYVYSCLKISRERINGVITGYGVWSDVHHNHFYGTWMERYAGRRCYMHVFQLFFSKAVIFSESGDFLGVAKLHKGKPFTHNKAATA